MLVEKPTRNIEDVDQGGNPPNLIDAVFPIFPPFLQFQLASGFAAPGQILAGPRAAPSAAVDSSFRGGGSGGAGRVPGAARGRVGCPPALGAPGARALPSGRPGRERRARQDRLYRRRCRSLPRPLRPAPPSGPFGRSGGPRAGPGAAAGRPHRWRGSQRARLGAPPGFAGQTPRAPFPPLRRALAAHLLSRPPGLPDR
ncbi:translation initiation factor IF-2-like [Mustela putorius furo]|uniref:Translation initiation factor IF-2-like n=1 Tax=Mustela putorius furo TaxID=9669 RepID=A0A8U0RW56_MUSPF|nr:translation initiation factor IF-2-like [Mustela putorius furo]